MSDNDTTGASERNYTRGDVFHVPDSTDPTVERVVVLGRATISGIESIVLAEQDADTGEWDAYPNKAQYLKDEAALRIVEPIGSMDEADVQGVEVQATEHPEGIQGASALEGVETVESVS